MSTQKLVRCQVGRPGREPDGVRFIPLELFGMWKYLMEHRHHFEVRAAEPSLWIELDPVAPLETTRGSVERVTELRLFVVSQRDGILHEVLRYVPSEDLEEVRALLLRHFTPGGGEPPPWKERAGIWFQPAAAAWGAAPVPGLDSEADRQAAG